MRISIEDRQDFISTREQDILEEKRIKGLKKKKKRRKKPKKVKIKVFPREKKYLDASDENPYHSNVMIEFAGNLRRNLPKSESWFLKKIGKDLNTLKQLGVENNYILGKCILDFAIPYMKICVEIDDKSHNKSKDKVRDWYVGQMGWETIRIKAFSDESFNKFKESSAEILDILFMEFKCESCGDEVESPEDIICSSCFREIIRPEEFSTAEQTTGEPH